MTFGQNGEPSCINGPRGDTYGVMSKLRQTAGDGNFDCLVQFPGPTCTAVWAASFSFLTLYRDPEP